MSSSDVLKLIQIPRPALHDVGARHNGNIFGGDQYAGLSETCLYYIGGLIKHAKAIKDAGGYALSHDHSSG
jgi:hypothetical protein